ncbi:hypothetical protein LTR56_004321 [Elasticomyces elasticus]|nr:hypothetical protein LTR22_012049 [Elasticomyces elasticus]KAK3653909.1 hypothetical protein LTR56_004321 [Elasticomyces elasticus]KAK4919295.1 hypothetical protein LTR49_012993 [Elasticomyces elasticus]KAK5748729.1 hypothetical protein LTS12_021240 [Elasticomyces elasticus]
MVFGIILIVGVLAFPESPRWLLKHGKEHEAAEIMGRLHSLPSGDAQIREDIEEINKLNAMEQGRKLSWKEFLSNGKEMNLWRAAAACGSQACQQIGGINLVTYYATTVFETSLKFSPSLSRFMTAWLGTEYFLAACAALFVVDKLGRRKLMMGGAAGMAISLLVIGVSLSQATDTYRKPAIAATVFIFVYNTCFAVGWLGVTWLYPAEITPIRIRAEANGFSTSTNWIFNYAVVQLAPIMINSITWKTYFVFFCFNVAFVPIVYFCFPETNGYKLEELDAIFAEAYEKGENPVFTERRYRKSGKPVQVQRHGGGDGAGGVEDEKEKENDVFENV